jgi:hypothetical protein
MAPVVMKRASPWAKDGACGRAASQMASRRAVTWSTGLSWASAMAVPWSMSCSYWARSGSSWSAGTRRSQTGAGSVPLSVVRSGSRRVGRAGAGWPGVVRGCWRGA